LRIQNSAIAIKDCAILVPVEVRQNGLNQVFLAPKTQWPL